MTLYYKMRQILQEDATALLLQHATSLLQNVSGFLLQMQQSYYKLRQLLSNETCITKYLSTYFNNSKSLLKQVALKKYETVAEN